MNEADNFDYVVIKGKINPSFRGGFIFTKSQIVGTYNKEMAELRYNDLCKSGKIAALYKTFYDTTLKCTTHLELIITNKQ